MNNNEINPKRNFFALNNVLKGVKIIKIRPSTLLIKNLGYLTMFVQN